MVFRSGSKEATRFVETSVGCGSCWEDPGDPSCPCSPPPAHDPVPMQAPRPVRPALSSQSATKTRSICFCLDRNEAKYWPDCLIARVQGMPLKEPPRYAALAAAEYLAAVWHDGVGKERVWALASEAFQDALGWGRSGETGLKKLAGWKSSAGFWNAVVQKYELADPSKRVHLQQKVVRYCKQELIVLHDGETLLECAARISEWDEEPLVVISKQEVIINQAMPAEQNDSFCAVCSLSAKRRHWRLRSWP